MVEYVFYYILSFLTHIINTYQACAYMNVYSVLAMNCSPPGSSVHGIFQAKILEWVAISYSWELIWFTSDQILQQTMYKVFGLRLETVRQHGTMKQAAKYVTVPYPQHTKVMNF